VPPTASHSPVAIHPAGRTGEAADRTGGRPEGTSDFGFVHGSPRARRVVVFAVAVLGLVLGACSGPDAAEVACTDPTVEPASGAPMDSVVVTGIPPSMGDSIHTVVRHVREPGDTLRTLALTRRGDSASATLLVPIHPSFERDGGPVELRVTNGAVSCPWLAFRVDSLRSAPGTRRQMAADRDRILDLQLRMAGISRDELAHARPDTLPRLLLPLLVVQRLLDGTDDTEGLNSLTRESGSPAANPRHELLDAVLAKSGFARRLAESRRSLERYVEEIDPDAIGWHRSLRTRDSLLVRRRDAPAGGLASHSRGAVHLASTGPSGHWRSGEGRARSTRSGRTGTGSRSPRRLTTYAVSPEKLDAMMDVALWADESLEAQAYREVAVGWLGVSATLADLSVVGTPLGKGMGVAAFEMWLDGAFRDFLKKMLPRDFVDIDITMSPEDYEEDNDDVGRIRRIEVTARSEHQVLDQKLVDLFFEALGAFGPGLPVQKFGLAGAGVVEEGSEGLADALDELVADYGWNAIYSRIIEGATDQAGGGSGLLTIPAREFVADVTDPEWSVVRYLRGESIRLTGRDRTYVPVDVGTTWLRIYLKPTPPEVLSELPAMAERGDALARLDALRNCNFGCKNIRRDVDVTVHPIEVIARPGARPVRPGQSVDVTAQVENAVDGSLRWRVDAGGGTVAPIERVGDRHRATVTVPDPMRGPVMVSAISLADRSHLTTAGIERSDQVVLTEALEIRPVDACLEPGEKLQYRAVAAGRRVEDLELRWSVDRGSITDRGLFTAGSAQGAVVVRARSPEDSAFTATAGAEIKDECLPTCRYSGMLFTPYGDFAVGGKAFVSGAVRGAMGSAGGYETLRLDAEGTPGAGLRLQFPKPYPVGRTGTYGVDLSSLDRGDARLYTEGEDVIGGGILGPDHSSLSLSITQTGGESSATPMEGTEFREALRDMQLKGSVRVDRRYPDGKRVTFEAQFDAGNEYACEFGGQLDRFSEGMEKSVPRALQEALEAEGVENAEELRDKILEHLPSPDGPDDGGQ